MADRQDSDREVLTSLPRSRPVRRSTKRPARPATAAKPAANKKAGAAPRKAAAKKQAGTPSSKATGSAKADTKSRASVTSTAAATECVNAPRARAAPRRERVVPTPEPERVAPPRKVPPAGYAAPTVRGEREQGSGVAEVLSTAVQAANELTQIGLTVGRQALQSLLDRLPKP